MASHEDSGEWNHHLLAKIVNPPPFTVYTTHIAIQSRMGPRPSSRFQVSAKDSSPTSHLPRKWRSKRQPPLACEVPATEQILHNTVLRSELAGPAAGAFLLVKARMSKSIIGRYSSRQTLCQRGQMAEVPTPSYRLMH